MSNPIACELYDYIEIACLFGYEVQLHLRDGSTVRGNAQTTVTCEDKVEGIQLAGEAGKVLVPLHQLARMQVITPNARFQSVDFTPPRD